jgi:5,5'-dehydrodivanillate O-demethylase
MLSEAKNKLLTQVERAAPMGALLRRYWHPVCGSSELKRSDIRPIRLFGENLVLYRDQSGAVGLVDRHCAHRRADLSYGFTEKTGIRCSYHGWLFDAAGNCIEQPYESIANPGTRLKARCAIKSYPLRESAGLVWAYLGPAPAPELPIYELLARDDGFAEIAISEVPCNWLQCQENSCDPVHFEWMHENWSMRLRGEDGPYSPTHLKLAFDEFEHGFTYRRIREGQSERSELWTVGRVALWPNGFYLGDHFEWRVPVDDSNTLSVGWFHTPLPVESRDYRQQHIPAWRAPIRDENGRWITSHIMNQDIVAWVGQGVIADRTGEHLGSSDLGIALIRRRLLEEIAKLDSGADPKGVIRDPDVARCVSLPTPDAGPIGKRIMTRAEYVTDKWFAKRLEDFPWHAGYPREILEEYRRAVGVE